MKQKLKHFINALYREQANKNYRANRQESAFKVVKRKEALYQPQTPIGFKSRANSEYFSTTSR